MHYKVKLNVSEYPLKLLGRKELAKNVFDTGPGYCSMIKGQHNVCIHSHRTQILCILITELGISDCTGISLMFFGKVIPLSISSCKGNCASIPKRVNIKMVIHTQPNVFYVLTDKFSNLRKGR